MIMHLHNKHAVKRLLLVGCGLLFALPLQAECWIADRLQGFSAGSNDEYQFIEDSFNPGMLVCFQGDSGTVTGNDLPLIRIGESTLIGVSMNPNGLETVNTYQIDREAMKLLLTQTRIGTPAITDLLPDYAAVFVGDIRKSQ